MSDKGELVIQCKRCGFWRVRAMPTTNKLSFKCFHCRYTKSLIIPKFRQQFHIKGPYYGHLEALIICQELNKKRLEGN